MTRIPTLDRKIQLRVTHADVYVAAGIAALLGVCADLELQDQQTEDQAADVVVADYEAGLALAASPVGRCASRRGAVLVITGQCAGWQIRRALDAGVRGYLTHDCSAEELVAAVRNLARGGRFLSAKVSEPLMETLDFVMPTGRQLDVLKLIAGGLSNRDIGLQLGIGERTVKTHVQAILEKFGVSTRTSAMAEALRRGILRST